MKQQLKAIRQALKKILIYPTTHIVMAALHSSSPVIKTIFA